MKAGDIVQVKTWDEMKAMEGVMEEVEGDYADLLHIHSGCYFTPEMEEFVGKREGRKLVMSDIVKVARGFEYFRLSPTFEWYIWEWMLVTGEGNE